ncbi:hypothetical protein [Thermus scotoductus]|uniref:Uncharacterized protein n=1 Tax=Thermus scotoductus TaxID=37636 RepID=A0A430S2L8_THESC|nr:hypothetical protein [Thermus scotoductus]RTG98731.1 hypothetical protein CSW51_01160 [Thermus scotoductus]RTH27977.1 hypothetical protein CSW38_02070 [Thermus scotoductus]RTH98083.1 hypothetical protein CSW29_10685 [Thermus scotoductus]
MTIYIVEERVGKRVGNRIAFPDKGKALEYATGLMAYVFIDELTLDAFVNTSFTLEITPARGGKLDMRDNLHGSFYRLPVRRPVRIMHWRFQRPNFQYQLNIIRAEVRPDDWSEYQKAAQEYSTAYREAYREGVFPG